MPPIVNDSSVAESNFYQFSFFNGFHRKLAPHFLFLDDSVPEKVLASVSIEFFFCPGVVQDESSFSH